jgi:hypothetical protein
MHSDEKQRGFSSESGDDRGILDSISYMGLDEAAENGSEKRYVSAVAF